jgi:cysteine desulfurase
MSLPGITRRRSDRLPVDDKGNLDLQMLRDAIRPDTILVSVMWANNEPGVIHPMQEIGRICAERGTLLFSDATQAVGKIPVIPRESGVQIMACSAHKFNGPKGIGAIYVSRSSPRVKLRPLIHGGGHEGGMRSGTLNVPNIAGLGIAIHSAMLTMPDTSGRLGSLRDQLESELLAIEASAVNGDTIHRLSHVTNMRFDGVDGAAVMSALSKELAIASGSACTSANPEPSHVLQAMGLSRDQSKSSLRISLGKYTTADEVHKASALLRDTIASLRASGIAWQLR